jgi:ATP phosphoribosyltransferase regulatory subunit
LSTSIRLPSGVRDFLPGAAARRRSLADAALAVFEAWGYARVITPVFEHAEVLERGLGDAARQAAIRFVEPGTGEVVALRPDITPQIARLAASRLADVEGPVRLCYEGALYRLAAHGQREILQAGVELVDAGEPHGDAEVLAVAAAALASARLPDAQLDIGHVAPARCVLDAAPDAAARDALATALARKDRAAVRAAARALPAHATPLAEALVALSGAPQPTLDRARALAWPAPVVAALDRLSAVLAAFDELADRPAPRLSIDLGDLRGFAYYTGMRFAGFVAGAADAVLRGGRYDELVGRYGRARPAVGFAMDLETVAQAQSTLGVAAPDPIKGVAVHGAGAAALARALRAAGLRALVETHAKTDWPRWLAGAGLDAAIVDGEAILVDGTRAPAGDVDAVLRSLG